MRSRARWTEFGEKNSKYFVSLEKRSFKNKSMSKLVCENGDVITDQTEIFKQELKFYSELYHSHSDSTEHDQFHEFLPNNVPKLSKDDKLLSEGSLEEKESLVALEEMSNNKKNLVVMASQLNFIKCFGPTSNNT